MEKKIFPSDYTDEELKNEIRQKAEMLEGTNLNGIIQYASLISLAQSELQTRQATKIYDAAKSNEKSASIFGYLSVIISIIAIIFAALSWKSSERWERKQLLLLEKLYDTSINQAKLADRILKLEQNKIIEP